MATKEVNIASTVKTGQENQVTELIYTINATHQPHHIAQFSVIKIKLQQTMKNDLHGIHDLQLQHRCTLVGGHRVVPKSRPSEPICSPIDLTTGAACHFPGIRVQSKVLKY